MRHHRGRDTALRTVCIAQPRPCRRCGTLRTPAAPLPDGGFICHTCNALDPVGYKTCSRCRAVAKLHHHGLCPRCACDRQLQALLATNPHHPALQQTLDRLRETLVDSRPEAVLHWLTTSKTARGTMQDIASGTCPLTHDDLDRRLTSNTSMHIRGLLVAAQILPPRDEQLVLCP